MRVRYVLKNKHTGQIHFKIYSIETIEREGLHKLFDIENYDIINRDRFTGLKDKNGVDIYENAIVACEENKFGNGRHEYWTVEYETPSFIVYNQLNSNRSIESTYEKGIFFSPDGTEKIEIVVIGNIHTGKNILK